MEILITSDTIIRILMGIIVVLAIIIFILRVVPKEDCPETRIIEKIVTKNPLDIQFSRDNFPSTVHNEMFVRSTPWIGGYDLALGKTYGVRAPNTTEGSRQTK